jgi:prepilin-type N-terminal cleavage/methylation domain-containing protein/prepilin-type processing-associated H-X9-DG protein
MTTSANPRGERNVTQAKNGFTLIELMTVVSIIGILASMLLVSISKATGIAQSVTCNNNLRQLNLAWQMYAHDHEDSLPPNKLASWNFDTVCPEGYANTLGSWVAGNAMKDTTTKNIRTGVLFPYTTSVDVYRCPTDKSKVDFHPNLVRTRSYALGYFMNGDKYLADSGNREFFPLVKEKLSELNNPAQLFTFIDEAPQAIQDGTFFIHYPGDNGERESGPHWMDVPADRHNLGANLGFGDGHIDHLRWRSPKSSDYVDQSVTNNPAELQDLRTLQTHTPEPPPAAAPSLAAN